MPAEQPDVVDLRDPRHEALNGPRDEILGIAAAERVVERAVDLKRVDVAGGAAAREPAFVAASRVDRLDQCVNRLRRQQSRRAAVPVRADVGDANAIVRVEHRDRVVRTYLQPSSQWRGVTRVECVQHERRQREVVHPVDLPCHVDLCLVMPVHFHQDVHLQPRGPAP